MENGGWDLRGYVDESGVKVKVKMKKSRGLYWTQNWRGDNMQDIKTRHKEPTTFSDNVSKMKQIEDEHLEKSLWS
jgi:hypothetical protein